MIEKKTKKLWKIIIILKILREKELENKKKLRYSMKIINLI
jgi:hypothetical protein